MEAIGCTLRHTLREENKVADRLANMRVDQENRMVSHIIPPVDIIPLLELGGYEMSDFWESVTVFFISFVPKKKNIWDNYFINGAKNI